MRGERRDEEPGGREGRKTQCDAEVLVGGRAYPLSESEVNWLVDRLRTAYAERTGPEAEAALAVAWAFELAEELGGPLEFAIRHAQPVLHVIHTEELPPSPRLIALQDALRRLQLDNREERRAA